MQTITKSANLFGIHLLDLVSCVTAFNVWAKCPAFNGLAQNCCWSSAAKILRCGTISRIQLAVIVTATRKRAEVVVAQVRNHLSQARVGAKEVFANIVSVFDGVALELAINGGVHLVEQHAIFVLCEQVVPLRTPNNFDDIPTSTAEHCFKFLNDFPVATHWPVKTLQVAVDDKHQVVKVLT